MGNADNVEEVAEASNADLVASCRRQLVEEKLLVFQDGQYFATEKGRDRIAKQFNMIPARWVLIEHIVLEQHGFQVD